MATKEKNKHMFTTIKRELGYILQTITFRRPPNKKAGEADYVETSHSIVHDLSSRLMSEEKRREYHDITHVGKAHRAINKDGSSNSQMHEAPSKLAHKARKKALADKYSDQI